MSSDPTLGPDFLQKLFASAFAVQESGVKSRSLAALVELERSIRSGQLDLEKAMNLIAEWARKVARASGVAIGRLKGDQLVYAAGSGTAAAYMGRHVTATFSMSGTKGAKAEILRVENSRTDGRIEAAVCRQLGVESLLILPIYCGGAVAGVLQVLFDAPHTFEDEEMCTYWLLAGLVGEAIGQAAEQQKAEEQKNATILKQPVAQPRRQIPPIRTPVRSNSILPAPSKILPAPSKPAACETSGVSIADAGKSWPAVPLPQAPPALLFLLQAECEKKYRHTRKFLEGKYAELHQSAKVLLANKYAQIDKRASTWGLVAASLIIACGWIVLTGRTSTMSPVVASAPEKSIRVNRQTSPQPPSPGAANGVSAPIPSVDAAPDPTSPRRTRVVANSAPGFETRVKYFGDDVTVHYFTPKPAVVRTVGNSDVRRISEDVTVRYFRPRNADAHQPVGSAGQSPLKP